MQQVENVQGIHHVHVWELDEQHRALEAHVVIDEANIAQMEIVKRQLKHKLADEFGVGHVTLEFEFLTDNPERCNGENPCS